MTSTRSQVDRDRVAFLRWFAVWILVPASLCAAGVVLALGSCSLFTPDRLEQAKAILRKILEPEGASDDQVRALFSVVNGSERSGETDAWVKELGAPCAGRGGVAPYVWAGVPRIGQRFGMRFSVGLARGTAGAVENRDLWVLFGAQTQRWADIELPIDLGPAGMPGCTLRVPGDVTYVLPANATTSAGVLHRDKGDNAAVLEVEIPALEALVGVRLYVQGIVSAPGENDAGFLVTQAFLLQIGR